MSKKTVDTAHHGAEQAREALTTVNSTFLKAFDQNRSIVQHLMRVMQEESLRFVNQRFEHTSRALERSRDCQGLSGFFNLQQDWFMDAARDYAEFNRRFGEVLHEVAEHNAENMHEFAGETAQAQKTMGERVAA